MPLYLARIYEDLSFDLPSDLEEYGSLENAEDSKSTHYEKNRHAEKLEELFDLTAEEINEADEDAASTSNRSGKASSLTSTADGIRNITVQGAPAKRKRGTELHIMPRESLI